MLHVSTHEATEYSLFSVDGTKTFDPTSCALKRRGARVEWCATPQADSSRKRRRRRAQPRIRAEASMRVSAALTCGAWCAVPG